MKFEDIPSVNIDQGSTSSFDGSDIHAVCNCAWVMRTVRVEVCGPADLVAEFKAGLYGGVGQWSVAALLTIDRPNHLAFESSGRILATQVYGRARDLVAPGLTVHIKWRKHDDITTFVYHNGYLEYNSESLYCVGRDITDPGTVKLLWESGDPLLWDTALAECLGSAGR